MIKIEIIDPSASDAPLLQALLGLLLGPEAISTQARSRAERPLAEVVARAMTVSASDDPSAGFDPNSPPDFAAARALPNGQAAPSIAGAVPCSTALAGLPSTLTLSVPGLPTLAPAVDQSAVAQVASVAPSILAATVDLDADGLPWDARIHSSNHEKNKGDQKWRAKRGVDASLVVRVEAELRAVMAHGGTAPALPNVAPAMPLPTPTLPALPQVTQGTAVYSGPTTFAQFLPLVTRAKDEGRISDEMIMAALNANGVPNMPALAPYPALVPKVYASLFPAG